MRYHTKEAFHLGQWIPRSAVIPKLSGDYIHCRSKLKGIWYFFEKIFTSICSLEEKKIVFFSLKITEIGVYSKKKLLTKDQILVYYDK